LFRALALTLIFLELLAVEYLV